MNRLTSSGLVALLLVGCGPKPEDVAARFEATFNEGDAAAIVSAFADDPYVEVDGQKMLNREEIGAWLSEALVKKPQIASTSPKIGANGRLTWTMTMQRSDWASLKLEPLPYQAKAVFDKEKVKMLTWTMDDASKAKLKSTIEARNAKWLAAIQDAIKTRNPPAVTQLVTPEVRFDTLDKTNVGVKGITPWIQELTTKNVDITCCSTKKDEDTWSGTMSSDALRAVKIEKAEVITNVGFAEDGHIKDFSISVSPESKAKIDAATAAAATTAAATPPKKHR